ncbi:hypothetical protein A2U01_0073953, partial [Trifolium medium]|nr:hypothetical protein [Trifolium medium]
TALIVTQEESKPPDTVEKHPMVRD